MPALPGGLARSQHTWPLIGREAAMAELEAVLDAARGGRGGFVLIAGEAGIGKTRLAEEIAARADGFTSIWSWCVADASAGPFRPWVHVVRELAASDPRLARQISRSDALAGLIKSATLAGDPLADAESIRVPFFDAVTKLVRVAARRPLLIIVDDLQAAQESSLWLLAHLVPGLRSMSAVVVATARDDERSWEGRLAVRNQLVRHATSLRLAALDQAQVADLLEHATGDRPGAEQARLVLNRSGGNPLLVSELVMLLGEPRDAVRWVVPGSVQAIAAERLALLRPACQRLASAAAVLGTQFQLDVLAEMVESDAAEVRACLDEAAAGGLIDMREPGSGHFVHELMRDATYDRLGAAERGAWHARAGAILSGFARRGRAIEPAEVAHHLLRAGPDAALEAAEFASRAGDLAADRLAYEDAANWYERAMRSLELSGADIGRRLEALQVLSEARLACGDRERARAGFLEAAGLARAADLPTALARAALGLGSGQAGFEVGLLDREQLDLLEEARAHLPEDERTLRALVTARLSVAATLLESETRRLELAREALDTARDSADNAAQAYALAALCDALAGPEHWQARLAYAAEIVERAKLLRNPPLELLGRRLRFVALLETGERAGAEAELIAYRTRAQVFAHPLYRWYVPLWRATLALMEGRFADCEALNSVAAAEGRAAGSHNAMLLTLTQRWCLAADQDDRAQIEALFRGIDFEAMGAVWPLVTSALVAAQLGDLDEARRRLDAAGPRLVSTPRDSEWLPCVAQVAELVGHLGQHPLARWTYDALLPFADLFVVEGIGAAVRGSVQRHLGLVAASMGERDLACQHFETALEMTRRLGAPRLVEHIQLELERVRPAATLAPPGEHVFRRDGEYWTVRFAGRETRLRDSKGMRDLALLLQRPGAEVAALDLATDNRGGVNGDSGEVLDAETRQAYRRRLLELEAEASEADAAADIERSSRIALERDALLAELTAAYGLGGRARRTGSSAERARSAVTARIRETIKRIRAVHPELGQHLDRAVRTGTFCVYRPEAPARWQM